MTEDIYLVIEAAKDGKPVALITILDDPDDILPVIQADQVMDPTADYDEYWVVEWPKRAFKGVVAQKIPRNRLHGS